MFIVGLTGGLATGKSTVLSIFRENGIAVIDADEVARTGTFPTINFCGDCLCDYIFIQYYLH